MLETILIIVAISLWLSVMLLAVAITIYPKIITITKSIICKKGETLVITKVKLSYHRPGEKGIVVEKIGPKGRENVKVKALLTLWIIFFLWTLLISLLINIFV